MKKISHLAFFLLTISPVNCQLNWAPFGSIWYYDSQEGIEPPRIGYLVIESVGDTVVNEIEMSVLKLTRFNTSGISQTESIELTYEKDSVIYIWKWGQPNVLYDFTKQSGEYHSVVGHGINDCGEDSLGIVIIDSVGTEELNGIESLYYYSSPSEASIWQLNGKTNSRYGNKYFFLASPSDCGIADAPTFAGPLRCYYDNEIGWIHFGDMPCDTFIVMKLEKTALEFDIQVYPNPSSRYVVVELKSSHEVGPWIYKMINSQGREIDAGILQHLITNISVENVSPGIFFFQLIQPSINYQSSIKMLKIIR